MSPWLTLILLLAAPPTDYAQAVRQDGPVAWWRLDDAGGETAADTLGAHPGRYHGTVTRSDGPLGTPAARCDGRTGYVEVPDSPAFALDSLTVECWVNSTQPWTAGNWPASATLVTKATAGNGSSDWTLLGGSDNGHAGCLLARPGPRPGSDVGLASGPGLNDGAWHHLVWTRASDGRNRLFIDGSLAAELKDSGGALHNDRPLQFGGDPWLKGRFLDGALAEVALYPAPLSAERVVAHYLASGRTPKPPTPAPAQTAGGWVKDPHNPVLGGQYGTCFDISVLKDGAKWRMWVSWRPQASIALVESDDGVTWTAPRIVLAPNPRTDWEQDLNRPVVLKRGDTYHLWYTGFNRAGSAIGYATSSDGVNWKRLSDQPVLRAEAAWEQPCVMCPHVLWDDEAKLYKQWYSGGERNEPNAIGYATSPDGLVWTKEPRNPIFVPDKTLAWERHKVTACQVVQQGGWYVMFYIGFRDEAHAQIGLARSRDGLTGWQRHPANPLVRPGLNQWDHDACYKPYAVYDGGEWKLWYNGRHGGLEQIGLVRHPGEDLGFGP